MIEYKEVQKKDGTVLIFCHFNDLLTEFYGTENYEGNLVHTGDHDEYIIHCPFVKRKGILNINYISLLILMSDFASFVIEHS